MTMAYEKKERLPTECPCGRDHHLSRAAMAAVITASSRGLLHTVGAGEITPICILATFDYTDILEMYDGRPITFTP
jgi:hypothetical protein